MMRYIMLVCAVAAVAVLSRSCGAIFSQVDESRRARERLLSETDHELLLEAGRESLRQHKGDPVVHKVGHRPKSTVVQQFPKVILDLAPEAIFIEGDRIVIDMFSNGLDHFGVFVYPEDFEGPKKGDRMLIEGLWYYDDKYIHDPKYDQWVDRMIKREQEAQPKPCMDIRGRG